MEEYGKKVLHPSPETEEYLVEEIKKASLGLYTSFCIISPSLTPYFMGFCFPDFSELCKIAPANFATCLYSWVKRGTVKTKKYSKEYSKRVILVVTCNSHSLMVSVLDSRLRGRA